jgi:hypothetical protein
LLFLLEQSSQSTLLSVGPRRGQRHWQFKHKRIGGRPTPAAAERAFGA